MTSENGAQSGAAKAPPVPRNLGTAGRKLWDSSTAEFEWAMHEIAVLEEACRTRDRIAELDAAVSESTLMMTSSQGARVHPAVSEARQQRLVLARLIATLGIPSLDGEDLPPARGARGVYSGRGRR